MSRRLAFLPGHGHVSWAPPAMARHFRDQQLQPPHTHQETEAQAGEGTLPRAPRDPGQGQGGSRTQSGVGGAPDGKALWLCHPAALNPHASMDELCGHSHPLSLSFLVYETGVIVAPSRWVWGRKRGERVRPRRRRLAKATGGTRTSSVGEMTGRFVECPLRGRSWSGLRHKRCPQDATATV